MVAAMNESAPKDPAILLRQALDQQLAGRLDDAAALYRAVLADNGEEPNALYLLGVIESEGRNFDAAIELIERALKIKPDFPEALTHLGSALSDVGRPEDGLGAQRQAAKLAPDNEQIKINLAVCLCEIGSIHFHQNRFGRARECLEEALAIKPDFAEAHAVLGNCRLNQADIFGAMTAFETSHKLNPFNDAVYSSYLFYMAFHPEYDAARLHGENSAWGKQAVAGVDPFTHPRAENKDRLKIGYLSYEFGSHVTSYFFEPLISRQNTEKFKVFVYAGNVEADQTTDRLKKFAAHWRDISQQTPDAAARTVYDDGIDILVLVSSYRARHRLPFAYKPAPIQVCYHNLVSTTGLPTMDYIITEELTDPAGIADPYYTENLVRISNRNCYLPPVDCPEIQPPPALKNGHVTFGTFNNVGKITPVAIDLWAQVLKAQPTSRLVIKNIILGDDRDWNPLRDQFAAAGIDQNRIEFLASLPKRADHLAAYHKVDIALDTFPCNGGTTSCDAIWMGVPVVTMKGDTFMGRQSANYLTKLNLDDLIAETPEAYVSTALSLAKNHDRLGWLRKNLRPLMEEHLLDYDQHATELEAAYTNMWKHHLSGAPPAPFTVENSKCHDT